ncbi:GDP-mannose 4,6-dehydratase [Pseudomonas sp. PDM23]|uniref:GDP-mannose 4,6-dehydratase n=1 Tax=unclassified Pseudomonas TaxID=196821 RepID=UPI001780F5B8|nr:MULTISPECIES: GDP-mannose 4,6-dehydratase [unclassified Pseudomonas]MBD9576659.1 GDP-mannose 4,6-dehydratase [Pseudomonas sp. PDM23]MBD9670586.1 GDP-mannose 4,6-dehydratase [Pseudomonas sp. PDM21]
MNAGSKRALITGFNGFTGCYMAAELERCGFEVFGLGTRPDNAPGYYVADLADAASLRSVVADIKPDVVVHLAALAFVAHGDANAFYQVNLIGARNLLEAIDACGKTPDCVLLASSANVYGNAPVERLHESTRPAPANDYAVSKLGMELMAKLWMDRLPIVIARPFNYTGVGQSENFLLPKIVAHFQRSATQIELGNLEIRRDFSDVRAVVQAYRRLLEVKPLGQTVNVCSGSTHSLREVLSMCEEITGRQIEVRVNPAFIRQSEVKTLCGDAALLRSILGDWSTPPLIETLRWMLAAEA